MSIFIAPEIMDKLSITILSGSHQILQTLFLFKSDLQNRQISRMDQDNSYKAFAHSIPLPCLVKSSMHYKSYLLRMTLLSDDAGIHNLSILKQQLQILINRSPVEITQSSLRQSGEFFLNDINEKFSNEQQIIRNAALKWNDFINSWIATRQEYEIQISDMNEEIEEKAIAIDNLQEIVAHLEKKVDSHDQRYAQLKAHISTLSQQWTKSQYDCNNYRLLLDQAQKKAQSTIEQHRHQISKISSEKEIILDQIKSERSISSELKDTIYLLQRRIEEYEKQSKIQENKRQEILKNTRKLQQTLYQKTIAINQLEKQKHNQVFAYGSIEFQDASNPLSIDTSNEKFPLTLNGKIVGMGLNAHQLERECEMDPYFAHYVLTSQSVKIKQDCEQLLNIDAKPFYSQIVEKRIPMHIWDQWIRNKLKQVLKQQQRIHDSQSEQ